MSEMVERVARAIHDAEHPGGSYEGFVAHTPDPQQYIRQARAAIEAMRNPTDAMCEAADWQQQSDVNQYQWAIDAALKQSAS